MEQVNQEALTRLFWSGTLLATAILAVWLIRRAQPGHRAYYFLGSVVVLFFAFGLVGGVVGVLGTLTMLHMMGTDADAPLRDVGQGLVSILFFFMAAPLYVFFLLLPLGSLHWIWMAIQMGSFTMFVFGVFPPTMIFVAAPTGTYALVFDTPQWVLNTFGP